jgi:hypothetical protein
MAITGMRGFESIYQRNLLRFFLGTALLVSLSLQLRPQLRLLVSTPTTMMTTMTTMTTTLLHRLASRMVITGIVRLELLSQLPPLLLSQPLLRLET